MYSLKKFIERICEGKEGGDDFILNDDQNEDIKLIESICYDEKYKLKINNIWDKIYHKLDEEYFSDKILNFLVNNDIHLIELSHSKIANEWLLKIYLKDNYYIEALQTVAIRKIFNEKSTIEDVLHFIDVYKNQFIYVYMLYSIILEGNMPVDIIKKGNTICKYILKNYQQTTNIYKYAIKYLNFFELVLSNNVCDINIIINKKSYLYLYALSKNENFKEKINRTKIKKAKSKYLKTEILNAYNILI